MSRQPERDLFVYRPVSDESLPDMEAFQSLNDDFPRLNAWMHSAFHSTTIGSREIKRAPVKHLTPHKLYTRLTPLPNSTASTVEVPVRRAVFLGNALQRKTIALELEDSDNTLGKERQVLLKRLGRKSVRPLLPHISLARIDPLMAIDSLLAWTDERAPATITLDPLKFSIQPSVPLLTELQLKGPSVKDTEDVEHATSQAVTVRRLPENAKIPQGFLDTLRKHTANLNSR